MTSGLSTEEQRLAGVDARWPELPACLAIAVGSIASVGLMLRHPSIRSSDLAEAVAALVEQATRSRWVHGGMIVALACLLFGFAGLSRKLGWHLARVRVASIAYALGVLFFVGAALVNGFVVSDLAETYSARAGAELEALRPILVLCHAVNQVLAQAGTLALAAAVVGWSSVLFARPGLARIVAGFGLALAGGFALGIVSRRLRLDLHGMGAVILAQTVWSLGVATWWFRSR